MVPWTHTHPDRFQLSHRAQVRLLCSEADLLVPLERPNVEPAKLNRYVELDSAEIPEEVVNEEPLPSELHPPELIIQPEPKYEDENDNML